MLVTDENGKKWKMTPAEEQLKVGEWYRNVKDGSLSKLREVNGDGASTNEIIDIDGYNIPSNNGRDWMANVSDLIPATPQDFKSRGICLKKTKQPWSDESRETRLRDGDVVICWDEVNVGEFSVGIYDLENDMARGYNLSDPIAWQHYLHATSSTLGYMSGWIRKNWEDKK